MEKPINRVLTVGPLKCRVMAERAPDDAGRFYWRIWRRGINIWNGWCTDAEVLKEAGRLIAEGGYVLEDRPRTLDSLIKRWSQDYRDRKDIAPGTKETSLRAMRHISRLLSGVRLDAVDQAVIDNYRDKRLSEEAAPSTILLEYRRLITAWNWGKKRGFCSGDLPEMNVVEYRTYNHYIPTDEEIEKTIELTARWTITRSRWTSIFLLIAYLTGARLNEVATLTWGRVNLEAGTITLLRKRTAGRNRGKDVFPHTIPIPERLIDALATWKEEVPSEPEDSVLTISRATAHSQVAVRLNRACKRAGVPVFTPHGLRYAAVRRFKRAGVPVGDAAEYFSHSPVILLRIYDEVDSQDLSRAVEKVYPSSSGIAVSESVSAPREKQEENPGSSVPEPTPKRKEGKKESPGSRQEHVEPVELHHELPAPARVLDDWVDWSDI